MAATALVLLADVIGNDRLQLGGFFGSSPALGARYYGFGNVASALVLTATILWSALHLQSAAAIGRSAWRSAWWRTLSVAAIVTVVIGTPGLGSDVGGLFTSIVAFGIFFSWTWSARSQDGAHLPWRRLLYLGAAGLSVLVVASIVDAKRTPANRTHLGELAARVGSDGLAPLADTIGRKVQVNLFGYGFPFSVLVVAAAVTFLVALLRGQWTASLPAASPQRIGAIAAMIAGTVAYCVNDSGIVTLVVVFVFLGPFLMVSHGQSRWGAPNVEVLTP
jgi:hypothetical protein